MPRKLHKKPVTKRKFVRVSLTLREAQVVNECLRQEYFAIERCDGDFNGQQRRLMGIVTKVNVAIKKRRV